MPILTKAQLEALNQSSFPDNASEAITPAILREYNTATIDTLVDSLDTGSYVKDISALNAFTASQDDKNATLAVWTGSIDDKFNTIGGQSGSWVNTQLNAFTASQNTKNSNLGLWTGSIDEKFDTIGTQSGSWDNTRLNAFTASQNTKNSNLAVYTQSVDAKFDTIGTQSGSYLITASFNNNTRNLTFTKENASTFVVNIPDASGSVIPSGTVSGSSQIDYPLISNIPGGIISSSAQLPNGLVSGSSQVSYTGLSNIPSGILSGSVSYTTLTNIPSGIVSGSSQVSYIGLSNIPSGILSGSVSYTTLTNIPTGIISSSEQLPSGLVSGSSQLTASYDQRYALSGSAANINTGSFATTGSNIFTNAQTISGSVNDTAVNGIYFETGSSKFFVGQRKIFSGGEFKYDRFTIGTDAYPKVFEIDPQSGWLEVNSQTNYNGGLSSRGPFDVRNIFTQTGNGYVAQFDGFTASLQEGYAWVGKSGGTSISVPTSSFAGAVPVGTATTGSNTFNGDQTISGSVSISGSFSAPLQQGYIWVGDVNGRNTIAPTSSFATLTDLTSLNAFTASQQNLNVTFATTGSNTFVGNETITGNLSVSGITNITPALVSANAGYPVIFVSGSTLSKDSVDAVMYNPTSNTLYVSASTGQTNITATNVTFISGSGQYGTYSSTISKTGYTNVIEGGGYIGLSGNPSKLGAPSLTTSTKPAILALSGSGQPYVAIEFQASGSTTFTDGRVTAKRLFVAEQGLNVGVNSQARFATGSNQQVGTATLDGGNPGSVIVSNSLVTADSIIFLTKQSLGNTHSVAVTAKSAGSFTITSTGNGDSDVVGWFIVNNS